MKKTTLIEWLIALFSLAPFVYLAAIWNTLPDQVPVHFNFEGQADRYSGKGELLIPLVFVCLLPWVLMRFLPSIDPKGKLQENPASLRNIRLIIAAFMGVLGVVIVNSASNNGAHIGALLPAIISALFMGLGNYMINVKPNYFIGIRTPWTLEDEDVWRKTHRIGGRMMFFGGLASLALSLLLPVKLAFAAFMILTMGAALIPVVLSYVYYRQKKAAA